MDTSFAQDSPADPSKALSTNSLHTEKVNNRFRAGRLCHWACTFENVQTYRFGDLKAMEDIGVTGEMEFAPASESKVATVTA